MVREIFGVSLLVLALGTGADSLASRKIVLKVNIGGGPVGDFLGEDQVYDLSGEFVKQASHLPIRNTEHSHLFQTQRFARTGDFVLFIPVPDGIYTVTLIMAETYQPACRPDARKFDISLGTPVAGLTKLVDSFDLFVNAGCNTAYSKVFENIPSREGMIVHLGRRVQHPCLAGLIVEGIPVPGSCDMSCKPVSLPTTSLQQYTIQMDSMPSASSRHADGATSDSSTFQNIPILSSGLAAPPAPAMRTGEFNDINRNSIAAPLYHNGDRTGQPDVSLGDGRNPSSVDPRRRLMSIADNITVHSNASRPHHHFRLSDYLNRQRRDAAK
jgi:Malectin domain